MPALSVFCVLLLDISVWNPFYLLQIDKTQKKYNTILKLYCQCCLSQRQNASTVRERGEKEARYSGVSIEEEEKRDLRRDLCTCARRYENVSVNQ